MWRPKGKREDNPPKLDDKPRKDGERSPAEVASRVWGQYLRGQNYLDSYNVYQKTEDCFNFYEGEQWKFQGQSLQTGGEYFPVENIISPIVNYKVAVVCMNRMAIGYKPIWASREERERAQRACDLLEKRVAQLWERHKMDTALWEYELDACVAGDVFLYFTSDCAPEQVDCTNTILGDEQQLDIQKQPYIIIRERLQVADVREAAREQGLEDDLISQIVSDNDLTRELGDRAKQEVAADKTDGGRDDGKTTVLLKMWKDKEGFVWFCRTTKTVCYQMPQQIAGLKLYPFVHGIWRRRKGSARGQGEVEPLIPNQIEINKNLVRRILVSKLLCFPRLAYAQGGVVNPEALTKVGAPLAVNTNSVRTIHEMIEYLQPASIGSDVTQLSSELIEKTRELNNASDVSLGSINPEQASGSAIIAARDQAQLPLNFPKQYFMQLCEDIGKVWLALLTAYNPNGLDVVFDDKEHGLLNEHLDPETLQNLDVEVRIDVSAVDPVSKRAADSALDQLFTNGHISFEEYIWALDENSNVPKAKLQEIIDRRAQQPTVPPLGTDQTVPDAANQNPAAVLPDVVPEVPTAEPEVADEGEYKGDFAADLMEAMGQKV